MPISYICFSPIPIDKINKTTSPLELRQKIGIAELPLALDLLEEIQRTGDIFFPNRWLSATVGQYQSPEAYQMVETFLGEHPELEPSPKGKLLQATDDLYRFVNH